MITIDSENLSSILKPVDVDNSKLNELNGDQINDLSFNLYKEAAGLLAICADLHEEGSKLDRNQAICVGLLVRTIKLMRAVMCLAIDKTSWHRGVTLALNRAIMESMVNLRFLIQADDPTLFDKFVMAGLAPEKEMYELLQSKIQDRGSSIPIEERMLRSVENIANKSQVTIDQVDARSHSWGGSYRDRLKALGEEEAYVFMQRLPSHAVHGSWVDLLFHHLKFEDGYFKAELEEQSVDARLFGPIVLYVLEGSRAYLNKFFEDNAERKTLLARADSLSKRTSDVEEAHEMWLQRSV